jgi:hypothetical protein
MRRMFAAAFAICPLWAQDPLEIVRRSLDRDTSNFEHLKNYTYQQREENRELDENGKLKKTESVTSEVLVLAGRPYQRVIARDDKALSEKDVLKEQNKMDRELARRQNTPAQEQARLEKRRAENRKFLRELPEAFSFRLLGEEAISGKPAWVIAADPRPDFHPRDLNARILAKVRGKMWVDKSEYQWVKMEGEILDTLSLGLALFRLAPGGRLSFEQTRVNDEVWLPAHVYIRADARLAYVKKMHAEIDITYRDYKKFQADSHIVLGPEK